MSKLIGICYQKVLRASNMQVLVERMVVDLDNYENLRNDLEHLIKGFSDFDNGFSIYNPDIKNSKIYLPTSTATLLLG